MMDRDKEGEGPLSSDELKRDEWRDGGAPKPQARGHTLPASEGGDADEASDSDRPNPIAGTMLPPD
jgi:hypothetical protein